MLYRDPETSLLLKAMIDLMNEIDPKQSYDSDQVTELLKQRGPWDQRKADTKERSINSYYSQCTDVFIRVAPNKYCLKLDFVRPVSQIELVDNGSDIPPRVLINVYRVLRDTEIARRLKGLYGNRCQMCGERIQLPDGFYSEAHHIKPLGRPHNGPDVAENILVLCPNHHVVCDHGTLHLTVQDFKIAPQHHIAQEFIDYHNQLIYIEPAN